VYVCVLFSEQRPCAVQKQQVDTTSEGLPGRQL